MSLRARLEAAIEAGQDTALARFTLGDLCSRSGELEAAIDHLQRAVAQDATYSAAWKILARALFQAGDLAQARQAAQTGREVAETQGDAQITRELAVLLRRIDKQSASGDA